MNLTKLRAIWMNLINCSAESWISVWITDWTGRDAGREREYSSKWEVWWRRARMGAQPKLSTRFQLLGRSLSANKRSFRLKSVPISRVRPTFPINSQPSGWFRHTAFNSSFVLLHIRETSLKLLIYRTYICEYFINSTIFALNFLKHINFVIHALKIILLLWYIRIIKKKADIYNNIY